jgi:vacuolar-type H+-ATPase subunit H
MPLGNDPTPIAELEAGFGVTSSAEQLITANFARMTNEQRAGTLLPVNDDLTGELRANLGKLEDHLGHEVTDATVRGSGTRALIHYVYINARDANEKDYVPFADVFGDDLLKRRRSNLVARTTRPEDAGREAAQEKLVEAESAGRQIIQDAQAKAQELLRDTEAKVQEMIRQAVADAEEKRQKIAQDAAEAEQDARERATTDKAKAEADKPQRRGDGAAGVSGTASGRTGKSQEGKAGGKD